MAINLPFENMSTEEKIQTNNPGLLCTKADSLISPPWHEKILNEREEGIKRGDDGFVDWDEVKKNIRNEIL